MQLALLVAMTLGAGPALLAMYYILRGFAPALEERKLFLGFGFGMILGLVGFTFHILLDAGLILGGLLGAVIYVVAFSALENLVLFVVLNHKWVRGKPEAAFVGVALGAGFSASGVMGLAYNQAARSDFLVSPPGVVMLVGLALSSTFLRTAAGALVGIGSARGTPWPWYGRALAAQLPYNALILGIYISVATGVVYWALFLVLLVAYSLWLLLLVWRNSIPEFVPGELKRRIRRERRRAAR
ncbi:MAG: hypothetical protein FJ149_03345 [Euryarchaeota archaeon]|nr:hypothetical protein [Euryarchaeota archaeon]